MSSRRLAKVAEAIRESISESVLFGIKDPRVKNVTVMRVDVAPDLKAAKIHVAVRGDDKTQSLCMHGLRSARGFLQAKLADRLQTRYTPILTFVLDPGLERTAESVTLLNAVAAEQTDRNPPPPDDDDEARSFHESWSEPDDDIDLPDNDLPEIELRQNGTEPGGALVPPADPRPTDAPPPDPAADDDAAAPPASSSGRARPPSHPPPAEGPP